MSTKPQDSASSKKDQPTETTGSNSQTRRTMTFAIVAVGCLAITGLFEALNRPASIEEYGKMGQEFYPEFTDPTVATSLTVSVVDPEEIKPMEFSVKQASNGQWVIPSHHNYPADAADQLAQTASSIIGIERGTMISRWATDHPKYGVVDPVTDSVSIDEVEGIGKRITLGGPDNSLLASYIIGNKYEDSDNQYYVRHPEEDETYIAELNINLSTKFGDWVNTDLLDFTNDNVLRLDLNDYSFDEIQGTITGNVESVLSRSASSEDWQLAEIDPENEQVKTSSVTETLNTLSNLEIIGVRPKQPGLTADLQIDRQALSSQRDLDRLTSDLISRGFILQPNRENQELLELISREGEMFVGTDDGLLYRLYFGRAFTGSSEELEIGLSSDESQSEDPAATTEDDTEAPAEEETETETESPSGKPGRYVFVRVNFDASLLGEVLTKPEEPQEPAEIKELEEKIAAAAANTEATSEENAETDTSEPSADAETETEDSQPEASTEVEGTEESAETDAAEEDAVEEETDEQKLTRLRGEFSAAQAAYQTQLVAFEEYEQKLADGQTKSDDLNRRFALWYYVIPGDSYEKLSLDRANIVEPKEAETPDSGAPGNALNAPPGLEGLSEAIMQNAGVNAIPPGTPAPTAPAPTAPAPAPTAPAPTVQGNAPESAPETPTAEGTQAPKADPKEVAEPTEPQKEAPLDGNAESNESESDSKNAGEESEAEADNSGQ